MGMDRTVTFAPGQVPAWKPVRDFLAQRGFSVQMRMINAELAFPEEEPAEPWQELRVGTSAGMVTLRRDGHAVRLVVWGNADAPLLQTWNALAWALAVVGCGHVLDASGSLSADAFRRAVQLPPSLSQ